MHGLALYQLAFRQNEWLSQRQLLVAGNISNANTPGYKTHEIAKFENALDEASPLSVTNAAHFGVSAIRPADFGVRQENGGEVLVSGNNVSVEQEFLKSGEVMRSFALNTQIIKAFNRMLFAATKA